jgi:hypothetical protein
MSQQMFEPQENQSSQNGQQDVPQRGWWATERSGRDKKTREMPKNEHPSTFEEPFTPAYNETVQESAGNTGGLGGYTQTPYETGYTAQASRQNSQAGTGGRGQDSASYRPYEHYNPSGSTASQTRAVPPWARPQKNSVFRILATIVVVMLVAMLILKVLLPLLIFFFILFAIMIGIVLFIGAFILMILRAFGISFRPWRSARRRRGWYFRI